MYFVVLFFLILPSAFIILEKCRNRALRRDLIALQSYTLFVLLEPPTYANHSAKMKVGLQELYSDERDINRLTFNGYCAVQNLANELKLGRAVTESVKLLLDNGSFRASIDLPEARTVT